MKTLVNTVLNTAKSKKTLKVLSVATTTTTVNEQIYLKDVYAVIS